MLINIHPENPDERRIEKIVELLKSGGVVIYPTDTVYSIGCDLNNHKAIERVAKIKGIKAEKANFSIIFDSLSHLSEYTKQVDTATFKLMKKSLPGPFTFILNANGNIPKLFKNKKKTIGIRIPDNNILAAIVERLGNPIIATSVHDDDEVLEYTTDPELIYEKYQKQVDAVVNGGNGNNEASTVIDCTGDTPEIIRQGIGIIEGYF
jgi:tRNA threonylcarbamoyl adenosine modification protein (Sua5/YciO/YrdC/YwlC family)